LINKKVVVLNQYGNLSSAIQKDKYVLNRAIFTYSKKQNKDI